MVPPDQIIALGTVHSAEYRRQYIDKGILYSWGEKAMSKSGCFMPEGPELGWLAT